jgi:hypothetical protein
MSQCLGSQAEAEREWQKKRVNYMSSYARYGAFEPGTSGSGMIMRSSGFPYEFELTPYTWLYPVVSDGSSDYYYTKGDKNQAKTIGRVAAGETIVLSTPTSSESQVTLKGINSYRNIGNFARNTPNAEFTLDGERLTEFNVEGTSNKPIIFNPKSGFVIGNGIDNLRKLHIKGNTDNLSILNYDLDLTKLWRLEDLDLSSTKITGLKIANDSNISSMVLPNTLTKLSLIGQKNLNNFVLGTPYQLTTLEIQNISDEVIDTHKFIKQCIKDKCILDKVSLIGINWLDVELTTLNYLLNIPQLELAGIINMKEDQEIDFFTKMKLIDKFGNIDSEDNDLTISYKKLALSSPDYVYIKGQSNIFILNDNAQYTLNYPYEGSIQANDFIGINWELNSTEYCSIDEKSGKLTLHTSPTGTNQTVTIRCTIQRMVNGEIKEFVKEKEVKLYQSLAKIGDYVYADGSYFDPDENIDKTPIAVCFYAENEEGITPKTQKRLAVSLEYVQPDDKNIVWGLSSSYSADQDYSNDLKELTNYSVIGLKLDTWDYAISKSKIYESIISNNTITGGALSDRNGKNNTDAIILYRNKILKGAQKTLPDNEDQLGKYGSEYQFLNNVLDTDPVYYPAASYCYAYKPGVKTGSQLDLIEKFTEHYWYLPSCHELAQIWYHIHFTNISSFRNIKDKLLKNKGIIWLWSSTEGIGNSTYGQRAWSIPFDINTKEDGNISCSGSNYGTGTGPLSKSNINNHSVGVLAVVEF